MLLYPSLAVCGRLLHIRKVRIFIYFTFLPLQAVWMRFFPAMVELRKRIANDEIGDVKFVNAHFGFRNLVKPERLTDPKLGGGSLLDVGVYPIQFATMIFGERPENIQTTGWVMETGVDEAAFLTLK